MTIDPALFAAISHLGMSIPDVSADVVACIPGMYPELETLRGLVSQATLAYDRHAHRTWERVWAKAWLQAIQAEKVRRDARMSVRCPHGQHVAHPPYQSMPGVRQCQHCPAVWRVGEDGEKNGAMEGGEHGQ